jgi:hypothetical protein
MDTESGDRGRGSDATIRELLFSAARALLARIGEQAERVTVSIRGRRKQARIRFSSTGAPVDLERLTSTLAGGGAPIHILRDTYLSPLEARLIVAIGDQAVKAQVLASRLGLNFSGKLKQALSTLRERGLLADTVDGYRLRHPEILPLAQAVIARASDGRPEVG